MFGSQKSFLSHPILSIVVPVFNQERFIGRCLRSLLDQTMPSHLYEIIVVDDGSSDKTGYALELFTDQKDSIIKVLQNKNNIGLPASLNKGINAAISTYIVRVDADDYVNTNFLNFLYYYLESNPDSDAVGCDYLLVNDVEEIIERRSSIDYPIACGILYKREDMIKVGLYDKDFLFYEDKDFRIRFERSYKVDHLNIPLYRYRRHKNNITNNLEKMNFHKKKLIKKHGKKALEY